jgi:gamma-glutamylcyclotransferase (GGCT)/AIG2-like uncharacterized protein YtfP
MIIGLILGDGSLIKKYENGNTYFKYAQSIKHKEYIQHIFDIFVLQNYCKMTKLTEGKSIVKGKTHKYLSFSTKSIQDLNNLRKLFYPPSPQPSC